MDTTTSDRSPREAAEKLRKLMKDVKFCMLTTMDEDGHLRSRPMTLQQSEFDGDLWFFTGKSSEKVNELRSNAHVNVSFAQPDDNVYVSISGRAMFTEDREKAKELWNPMNRAWFPHGLEDPNLLLLRIDVDKAEYWDSPNGLVAHLIGVVKATVTGKAPSKIGEHEKIELRNERQFPQLDN